MLGRFLAIYAILGGFGLIFEPHLLESTITHGGYRTIDYASTINQLQGPRGVHFCNKNLGVCNLTFNTELGSVHTDCTIKSDISMSLLLQVIQNKKKQVKNENQWLEPNKVFNSTTNIKYMSFINFNYLYFNQNKTCRYR